jgi:hypothetical protein
MPLFRRGPSAPPVTDFWSWWTANRDRVAAAITSGGFDRGLIDDISRAVRTIDPAMGWELSPGRTAQHAFCISPEGNAAIRPAALGWLAAAPVPDATWEYYASKQAAPSLPSLKIGNVLYDLEAMRTIGSWDETRQREDVQLWHPGFDGSPEAARIQVGFIFLDKLLGEDAVERWIGQIGFSSDASGGLTPTELRTEIDRRASTAPTGHPWVIAQRLLPNGQREIISADAALKRIDHPYADKRAVIRVLVADGDWLPDAAQATVLNAEEDDLVRRFGDAAVLAARTTSPGQRAMHFVTADPGSMRPAIDGWAADLPDTIGDGGPARRIKAEFGTDVDWSFQKALGAR